MRSEEGMECTERQTEEANKREKSGNNKLTHLYKA